MSSVPTRCLSVRQPYAWAICAGMKDIENRSWPTNFRGTIAIHAGRSRQYINHLFRQHPALKRHDRLFQPSAIIGTADVVDCLPLSADLEANPWATGTYCWVLENPRLFSRTIPMNGKLNLFQLDDKVIKQIELRLAAPAKSVDAKAVEVFAPVLPGAAQEIFDWRVTSYNELEEFGDLLRLCTERLAVDGNDSYAWQQRASANFELDNYEQALSDANETISRIPDCVAAYLVRSIAKEILGDLKGAKQDYNKAIELRADLPPWNKRNE